VGALVNFIMQGPFQALAVAGVLGVLSQILLPLALLSNGVIALCILTWPTRQWLVVLIGTLVLVIGSSYFVAARPGIDFPLTLLLMAPMWLSAKALAMTESQSLSVLIAVVCALILALTIQLVTGDAIQWWAGWLKIAVSGVKNVSFEGFSLELMNGLMAMMFAVAAVLTVFIGRWLQAVAYNPGGFAREFARIRFSFSILAAMLVVLLVTAVINEHLFKDFILIFTVAYFFQGLSVLHFTANTLSKGQSYLWPPYLLLFFFPQFVIVGLASVGLVDVFLNFRKSGRS